MGETTGTITVQTFHDTVAEASEKFTLELQELDTQPDGVELGARKGTATITDDAVTVTLSGDTTVNEGGAAEYTVSLAGFTDDEDIIVSFAVESDTATAAQDYSPASGTLTLNSEQASGTFTIPDRR